MKDPTFGVNRIEIEAFAKINKPLQKIPQKEDMLGH